MRRWPSSARIVGTTTKRKGNDMTTYQLDDDTVVDTDRAVATWDEATDWDGSNHISRATGSQWLHARLYRSRKGRFYVEHTSQWQGSRDGVTLLDDAAAVRWLLLNGHEVPEDIAHLVEETCE